MVAISSQASMVPGQSFGSASNESLATYAFSSATLEASTTYYVVFFSSVDGLGVGSTISSGDNITTMATQDGNYLGTDTYTSALALYTVYYSGRLMYFDYGSFLSASIKVSLEAVAVPEPSSFGLLAGLGALALVASRRRRRSRSA